MKKTPHRTDPRRTSGIYRYILLILICVLFIALYTFTLQKSYSKTTLQMAVERNSSCSDTIHRLVSNKLTREDFDEINTIDDMQTERYQRLQRAHELDQQQKLAEAAEKAEAANNAKSTFLFNMSHDIRTPMNAILGYADLARNHLHEPEKLGEYMDYIRVSGEQLLSIINNVLMQVFTKHLQAKLVSSIAPSGAALPPDVLIPVVFVADTTEKHQVAAET